MPAFLENIKNMSVGELVTYITIFFGIISIIVEKSKKLPFNPWSALFRWIGTKVTEPLNTKLDDFSTNQNKRIDELEESQNKRLDQLEQQNNETKDSIESIRTDYQESMKMLKEDYNQRIDRLEYTADEKEAKRLRSNIICFSDSCKTGTAVHTKRHFENIFRDYDDYVNYCKKRDLENHFIDEEIEYIKEVYKNCTMKNDL